MKTIGQLERPQILSLSADKRNILWTMDEKHVADYFIISGVSENSEFNTESKQLINAVLPITDVTVIFRGLGENCPDGYQCIETTPGGHLADLNNGNFKSPNIQICYRRGNDKPPLIEVGVYHEDKERVLPDVEVVYKTPYGRSASTAYNYITGNSNPKSGTFITYRRAKTNCPFNQLVVVDLCVILNNKNEHPPHAFYSIRKNLNKSIYGMIGSEVFLCYKKTLLRPPSLCYTPQIISRFPLQDYANFPLPDTVPLFCLPTGANIELWPANTPTPRPISSTFVLTSDSAQKIYGFSLTFYEPFDDSRLTLDQRTRLGLEQENNSDSNGDANEKIKNYETHAIKSICILSRWPFFDCFEKFLMFLHKLVFNPKYSAISNTSSPNQSTIKKPLKNQVPLEHYISHFLLDVSFPTQQRPTVIVQLMPGADEAVEISQPSNILPLPLTGASFCQLLSTLGVENTMNVLLFGLSEQKILLHSLRPWVLTGVAEAISAMFFPFHWQCPYVPLCPLSLHGILNAPLPFIVGIDSRCFDTFTPPGDIICIDLDTKSIFLSELKKCLNIRILPKRATRVLRSSLDKIFQKLIRVMPPFGLNQSPQHKSTSIESSRLQLERKFELEIQEAFVRFMATILSGFRSYLLPITSAPTVGATDPTSLFDFEGFLMSRDGNYHQFYQLITKTQMFTHYIEERSFVSDKDTSLAFFDDCEEKLTSSEDIFSDRPIKLFDKDDNLEQTDRSVYIPAPEQSPSVSANNSLNKDEEPEEFVKNKKISFGPLNSALFHRHPQVSTLPTLDKTKLQEAEDSTFIDNKILFDNHSNEPNSSFSISRRTKQEVKTCQKFAKKSYESPLDWSKYLVSCCHSLWFSALPSYIAYCKLSNRFDSKSDLDSDRSNSTTKILKYAYSTLVRMQRLRLTTDEICFRVLTLLCGHHGQPDLAVQVFFEMKKAGIKPNAVTYGYYNKAVLESRWPDEAEKPQAYTGSVEYLAESDNISSDETRSNRISDSVVDQSESMIDQDDELGSMRNLTSSNFKLASLINDASNMHWSKWTSSQNSKSVYKGIKSAATGIVSSLQEIKSSFSISNSNTPSKLLTSAHHTSSATKEMLSQWANSMFATPIKDNEDSDDSSIESGDLIKLDDDNDGENTEEVPNGEPEASDFRDYQQLFQALGEYHSNSSSREDLVDHLSNLERLDDEDRSVAIIIRVTTSSRCNACHSLLNDEEIMERWSPNESNLNTKCIYCSAKIVPFMKISLEDRRFTKSHPKLLESGSPLDISTSIIGEKELSEDIDSSPLVDLSDNVVEVVQNDSGGESTRTENDNAQSSAANNKNHNQSLPTTATTKNDLNKNYQHNFTVPYLSPIVLRKELESVYESSGDSCLASNHFIDEHPIVYWNLLWYFNRINVPTHLALLCLDAKSILNGKKVPANWLKSDKVIVLNQSRVVQEQRSVELIGCPTKGIQRRNSLA